MKKNDHGRTFDGIYSFTGLWERTTAGSDRRGGEGGSCACDPEGDAESVAVLYEVLPAREDSGGGNGYRIFRASYERICAPQLSDHHY